MPQLRGDGDTFSYQFPLDGDYVVTLSGHVADVSSRTHQISGTYDLTAAKVQDIEAALLPGTPFEVGDSLPVVLTVLPPASADVAFTVTHVASDGTITTTTYTGKANEGGWWDGDGEAWTFQEDGEYRVDVLACYAGLEGGLWAGRLRFGSAVATPNAPIAAHGRRGSDGVAERSRPLGSRARSGVR